MRYSGSKCVAEAPPRNDPPCDSEIPFIRDIISEALTRVDALEPQIRNSGEIPTRLVDERAEAMERVRKHRGILSPVRRMPPELVCGIFALLLEDSDEILPKPLWHLGHICRSWRLFVLGDTQFWSCITIPTAPLRPGDCAMIETQLLRSANAPLKCSRWTSLRLVGSVPRIQHRCSRRFLDRPKLAQRSFAKDFHSMGTNNPLSRHTHREISAQYRSRAAPSLVQSILGFEDSLFPAHSSITLPHLRSLYISDAHILEYLSTPVLEDLFYTDLPTTHTSRLLSFVRSSQCSLVLKTLVLMDCCIDPDLITVLRDLPNLASQEQGQPAFFDAMTISGTSSITPVPIPPNSRFTRLRVFDVNGYLESDQMSGPTGIDSWIRRLREEGLDAASFHVDRLLRS
ncbi:hypothetical protein B0H14DRAFT_2920416 [Mycena olivaceomarginata]|nr:hypothetical protein B0H14DRAFT_2920416 [Mycena olivaceomarginata]